MRALGVVGLAACSPTLVDDPVDTDVVDVVDDPGPPLAFAPPPDAADLDAADDVVRVALIAQRREDGGYAWSGVSPGPTIRAKVGDTVIVDVENALDEDTTVHWHGVDVPFDMDGSALSQPPIGPGQRFTYTFVVGAAGTFWYHPHTDAHQQHDRGLYGAIVVVDPGEPVVEHDWVVFVDTPEPEGDHDHVTGPLPTVWAVNGRVGAPRAEVRAGETVRLRWVNPTNEQYLDLRDVVGTWLASDQGRLGAARAPSDGLVLGPGDRAETVLAVAETSTIGLRPYTAHGGAVTFAPPIPVLTLTVATPGAAPPPRDWGFVAAPPTPDPGRTDQVWVLQGDGDVWLINGESWPDVTIPEVARDAPFVIELRNLSAAEHPFHLHGRAFEVLSIDGAPPAVRTLEDTVNVPIRGVVRLLWTPRREGIWLAHCHILPHMAGGMITAVDVITP